MIFETGQLSPGQHKLIVGYNGNGSTVPLFFNYFVQQDGLGPSSTSSGPLASGTSMSSSSSVSSSSTTIVRQPIEAIIGGVIGRLVLIFLLIALLFFNRRSKNWKLRALSEMSYTAPFPYVALANSFNVPSSNPASLFLPEDYTSNGQSLPSQFVSEILLKLIEGVNPLIPRACPALMTSHLWLHSVHSGDRSFHHQCSSLPHHHLYPFLDRKPILMVRGLQFHRPKRSLLCNGHLLEEPMPDFCDMKTAVFIYQLLKTRFSNYLRSTHLDDIDSF